VFSPGAALAATCTDSWAKPVSGLWTTAEDWSTGKVPSSSDNVCITTPGTYTVTVNGAEVNSLTLGATSGAETQTLYLSGEDPELRLAANSTIDQKGVLDWEPEPRAKPEEPPFDAKIVAPSTATIENLGKVLVPAGLGKDLLKANLTNAVGGTFHVQSGEVDQEGGATFTNEGALQVDSGALYELFSTNTFINDGNVANNGRVYFDGGASRPSWTEQGTESGNAVQLAEVELIDTSGNGNFDLIDEDSIGGMIGAGQTVTSEGYTFVSGTLTNHGTLALYAPTGFTRLAAKGSSPQIQNDGLVTSQGTTFLQIPLTNAVGATVKVDSGEMEQEHSVTFTNEGALQVESGALYELFSTNTFINDGHVVDNGRVYFDGPAGRSTWTENGAESGNAVQMLDVNLVYTSGSGAFDLIDEDSIAGTIPAGQTVTSEGHTYVSGTVTNRGTLALYAPTGYTRLLGVGSSPQVQNDALVTSRGSSYTQVPVTNATHATVDVESGELIQEHSVTVTNDGTLQIESGATIDVVVGSLLTDGAKGATKVGIASATSFGAIAGSGAVALNGTLSLVPRKTFTASLGQTYAIIASGSRTGTFTKLAGTAIKKSLPGLYYDPDYSPTGVTLVVTQAKVGLSQIEGPGGSSVTLAGSVYPPGETVKLTFTDKGKHKTTLPSVKANGAGEFTTEFTIPVGASLGAGSFAATSAATGKVTATFTVA